MALLQISEPGQSPNPHQRRIAVGIDLGTTHSLVASLRHGNAECLPDADGKLLLTSAVRYLENGGRQIILRVGKQIIMLKTACQLFHRGEGKTFKTVMGAGAEQDDARE